MQEEWCGGGRRANSERTYSGVWEWTIKSISLLLFLLIGPIEYAKRVLFSDKVHCWVSWGAMMMVNFDPQCNDGNDLKGTHPPRVVRWKRDTYLVHMGRQLCLLGPAPQWALNGRWKISRWWMDGIFNGQWWSLKYSTMRCGPSGFGGFWAASKSLKESR